MNKDVSNGKLKRAKGNTKGNAGNKTDYKPKLAIPKICPSCQNPRWDKTARHT